MTPQVTLQVGLACRRHAECHGTNADQSKFIAWNSRAQSLFLFMNQRDVISVAKFVQQLQSLMETLLRAPTDDSTT
jgi:hypothetical protein